METIAVDEDADRFTAEPMSKEMFDAIQRINRIKSMESIMRNLPFPQNSMSELFPQTHSDKVFPEYVNETIDTWNTGVRARELKNKKKKESKKPVIKVEKDKTITFN